MRLACSLCAAVLLACVPRQEPPAAAYRSFVRSVAERDAERAWGLLSSDTRAWMEARARSAAAAAPGVLSPDPTQLLLGTAARAAPPLASVVVVRESRDAAVVEAQEAGGPRRQVELVRERGWRVRLPEPPRG